MLQLLVLAAGPAHIFLPTLGLYSYYLEYHISCIISLCLSLPSGKWYPVFGGLPCVSSNSAVALYPDHNVGNAVPIAFPEWNRADDREKVRELELENTQRASLLSLRATMHDRQLQFF